MVDRMLILVRHAMPAASPDTSPSEWTLSPDGLRAARELRALLPLDARKIASTEPKAWQTLGDTSDVARDARFREIDRPVEAWSEDFRARRAEYVSGARYRGWEAHREVAERFAAGIEAHHPDAAVQPVVVATHGMAMTVWLVSIGAVPPESAAEFWRGLRFPDCHLVDLATRTVRRWPAAERRARESATPD
jgi:broad specificity phosphatase PhoE